MYKNKFFSIALLFLLTVFAPFIAQAQVDQKLLARPNVRAFIHHMVAQHHFSQKQLEHWIGQAKIQSSILTAIAKPAEVLPWYKYETIFLTPQRVQEGVAFWQANAETLRQAQQEFGVPAEIIVAILGVETFYGKRTGDYKVLDSLVTLAFNYPPRSKFFLSELEHFLLLSREEQWDPTQIKGSYAGAMGKPQFISSSYRHFAIDFNGNGNRDLFFHANDAIGSVANYFNVHGWEINEAIIYPAKVKGNQFESLIANKANPKPEYSLQALQKAGVQFAFKKNALQFDHDHFALIALEEEIGPAYWIAGQNFYVITRYNHSTHYAMAVYLLSQEVKKAYLKNRFGRHS